MIDPQTREPVDRTSLTKAALAGQKKTRELPLFTKEEEKDLASERHDGKVVALDASSRTVTLAEGKTMSFDLALIATGGTPRALGVQGEDLPRVRTIRHSDDVDAVLEQLGDSPQNKRVVIVGDSFIAFEAASSLRGKKLAVTVVARATKPFAKQLGDEIADAVLALYDGQEVVVLRGMEAHRFSDDGVTVSDGSTVAADLILVAVGVAPATVPAAGCKTAKDGSLAVGRDLLVAPGVWAAGDVATVDAIHIEHWRVAQQHGRFAALAMLRTLGGDVSVDDAGFHGVPFFWTLFFDKRVGYVGHAEEWEQTVIDGDLQALDFLAYLVTGGEVKAIVGCGREGELAHFAERMRDPLTLTEARASCTLRASRSI